MTEIDIGIDAAAQIESKSQQSPETSLEDEARIAIEILKKAEVGILERVKNELGPNHKPPLAYHTLEHSLFTKDRATELFDHVVERLPWVALEMDQASYISSPNDNKQKLAVLKQLLAVLCLGHDIVQDGFLDDDGVWKRHRGVGKGGNEYESARQIIAEIKTHGGDDAFDILQKFGITEDRVEKDLESTFVDFQDGTIRRKMGKGHQATRIQQSYFQSASFVGQCMALADLYGSYSNSDLEHSTALSFAEFREMNQWIYGIVEGLKNNQEGVGVTEPEIQRALSAMGAWLTEQPGFLMLNAEGLKENTDLMKNNLTSTDDKAPFGRIVSEHFSHRRMRGNGLAMQRHNHEQLETDTNKKEAAAKLYGPQVSSSKQDLVVLLRYFGYDIANPLENDDNTH